MEGERPEPLAGPWQGICPQNGIVASRTLTEEIGKRRSARGGEADGSTARRRDALMIRDTRSRKAIMCVYVVGPAEPSTQQRNMFCGRRVRGAVGDFRGLRQVTRYDGKPACLCEARRWPSVSSSPRRARWQRKQARAVIARRKSGSVSRWARWGACGLSPWALGSRKEKKSERASESA